jgi:hypothetical protein
MTQATHQHETAQAPLARLCTHDPSYLHGPIWALYYASKDGPLEKGALDVIADKARHEADEHMRRSLILPFGSYDRQSLARRSGRYNEVRHAAIALIDHLDGHEGFTDARDELEAALEVL